MENTNIPMLLKNCFHCYENSFCPVINKACQDFLNAGLNIKLIGASYRPAFYWKDSEYFVSQINHAKEIPIIFKVSEVAANLMLTGALGARYEDDDDEDFELKNLTNFEAYMLTAYNDFLYKKLKDLFLDSSEINSLLDTIEDEKILYLTFYVTGNKKQEAGKIILSFPRFIFRKTNPVPAPEKPVCYEFFNESKIEISVLIGKSRVTLNDLNNLEPEDIIILEQSNLYSMNFKPYTEINININPSIESAYTEKIPK